MRIYFTIIISSVYLNNCFKLPSQNLRRAFELQSTMKWKTFSAEVKNQFLKMTNMDMDMAKDISFLDWLDMPLKKETM